MRTFSTLKRGPTGQARMATALAAVGALVMSGGLVMLGSATASATPPAPDPEKKVVVCKYVSTPEATEYLHHIIIVSRSTLKKAAPTWDGESFSPPVAFTDAQGGSKAIRFAAAGERASSVSLSECPGYEPPGPSTVPFQTPDVNDDCGIADDLVVLPKSPDRFGVTYTSQTEGLSYSFTITAPSGMTLQGTGGKTTITQTGQFTDEPCPEDGKKVVVCKYVGPPPGVADHIVIVSDSVLGTGWDGKFPASFPDAQDSVAIRYATENEQAQDLDVSVLCPDLRAPKTPAGISTDDPCGPANVIWAAQPDEYFTYGESNGVVTATLKDTDKYVATGLTQWRLSAYERNIPCSTTVTIDPPGAPGTTDPCGAANIRFNVPADTAQLDYTLLADGNVTVSPKAGYVFSGNSQLITFTLPADSGAPCIAGVEEIAPAVIFTDPDCADLEGAGWTGNLTDAVDYQVTGTPGLGESITVTATVKAALVDRFAFPVGFDNTFDHTYPTLTELECVLGEESVLPTPKPEKNPPVVLGTEAAVPTQVNAGMASLPTTGSSTSLLLAQLMVAGGLLLLIAGGWVGFAGRDYGKHHI